MKRLILRVLFRLTGGQPVPGWHVTRNVDWHGERRTIVVRRLSDSTSCILGIEGEPGASGLRFAFVDALLKEVDR